MTKFNAKSVINMKIVLLATIAMAAVCDSRGCCEVEKAFIDSFIVPAVISVAPKKIVNVSYLIVKKTLGPKICKPSVIDQCFGRCRRAQICAGAWTTTNIS